MVFTFLKLKTSGSGLDTRKEIMVDLQWFPTSWHVGVQTLEKAPYESAFSDSFPADDRIASLFLTPVFKTVYQTACLRTVKRLMPLRRLDRL